MFVFRIINPLLNSNFNWITSSIIVTTILIHFGFKEVKILDGNIGYLDLRGFMDTRYASETAVAAMNFLSSADVIIIDRNTKRLAGKLQLDMHT